MTETIELLLAWTPYLAAGFGRNLAIASLAMLLGTSLGGLLVLLELSPVPGGARMAMGVTAFFRNVPTLVLLFYLSTLLPNEWSPWGDQWSLSMPAWVKAAIALSASPMGFTAWNLHAAIEAWRRNDHRVAAVFFPNWLGSFLITLLASSVSSLVGVDELVSRSNTLIKATGNTNLVPVYLYASLYFVVFGMLTHKLVQWLRQAALSRFAKD